MCIFMRILICVFLHVHIYMCIFTSINIHTYKYIFVHTHIRILCQVYGKKEIILYPPDEKINLYPAYGTYMNVF
jgi:hypothetical protein